MITPPLFDDYLLSFEENIQSVKKIRRLKHLIEKKELQNKYSPQSQLLKKCIPAGFSHQSIYGELTMSFSPAVFDPFAPTSKSKQIVYRCHMLGYSKLQQPLFPNQITYTIHTNNKMFKSYLKDMKICVVDILDARNYQSIGHCYLNWLMHMRPMGDEEAYVEQGNDPVLGKFEEYQKKFFLPFIDEECKVTLPVFDYRNSKAKPVQPQHQTPQNEKLLYLKKNPHEKVIGQVEVKFTSRVYENPIAQGYNLQSQDSSETQQNNNSKLYQQSNKGHAKLTYLQIPKHQHHSIQNKSISLTNLLPEGVPSKQIPSNALGADNIDSSPQGKYSHISSHPMKSQYSKQSQKIPFPQQFRGTNIWPNDQQCQQKLISKKNKKQNFARNEIQLMQLKLQVEEFFDVKQSTAQPNPGEQVMILNIVKLKSKLQNINLLDIFVGENQISQQQIAKNVDKRQRIKIYRVETHKSQSLDLFKSKIIIENASIKTIEVQLPNHQGKCSFRCKDLIQTYNDICVYNKGIIVGVLTVKKQIQYNSSAPTKNLYQTQSIQREINEEVIKPVEDKICIILIDNFMENFHKKFDINEISNFDNYFLSIKNVSFHQETLSNSKMTGDYAIINSLAIPKIFAVQVKNSNHQFLGMSQNILFQGNQVSINDKNIMPTLILERNISIQLKKMPVFKKIPNLISFRLTIYICNANQLNFFINKWKQNLARTKMLEAKRQRTNSNPRTLVPKHSQKRKQKRHTISEEGISQGQNDQKRSRTQSQNKKYNNLNHHQSQSKSSDMRNEEKQSSKTHGNYTIDLQNCTSLDEKPSQRKQNEEKYSQYSHKQDERNDPQNEEIYLVQFFCKSLHYILSQLGSKNMIEEKLTELSKFETKNEQSKNMISRQDFQKILHLFIGSSSQNYQQLLGFDVNEILEALFTSEDNQMINLKEFALCLMAYYNFLLLLANEKFTSLKEMLIYEPEAQSKLQRIQQSITNISSEFLWEDMLPNVLEKTKKKINKRYRIYANTPFSVDSLLKDIKTYKKNIENSSYEPFFINLLKILLSGEEKKEELFMRTTADLGNLVRQTVEQIIFAQCLKSSNADNDKNWFQKIQAKMQDHVVKQNLQSISSDQKYGYFFNLTQFQEFFIAVGIETSIWESLMLIQEIKVWYQADQTKNQEFSDIGEGVITFELLKSWLKGLKFKVEMKNNKKWVGQKFNSKSPRLNSIQSIDSEEQYIIEEMNSKRDTIKNTIKNSGINTVNQKYPPKPPINKLSTQQIASELIQQKYLDQRRRQTQKSSLKESQSIINNESDIANIANLLRQNDNNLYFLPSMVNDPMKKLVSEKNISDSDILRGLDYETLRNEIQVLPTKKTKITETNRNQDKKIQQAKSQTDIQLQEKLVEKLKPKFQPIDAFLSVSLNQIKLKKKQTLTGKLGLKKMIFSMDKSSNVRSLESDVESGNEYFFFTQDVIEKIVNNDCSLKQMEKYRLKSFKIDINNLYELETTYNQGFSLKLMNLTSSKNKLSQEKIEELLVSGILPIEDLLNVVEEFKTKYPSHGQQSESLIVSKRKTMVLYSGRQLNGKAVLEVSVCNKAEDKLQQDDGMEEKMKYTNIQFSFIRKALRSESKRNMITREETAKHAMRLCYSSIRSEHQNIEILPKIEQNQVYEIHLPDPIIEYQLVICASNQQNNKQEPMLNSRINQMSGSRFTRIGNYDANVQDQLNQPSQQCVIPLQNLYFKRSIQSQYPFIDRLTGRFVCTVEATLHVIQRQKFQSQEMSQLSSEDDI